MGGAGTMTKLFLVTGGTGFLGIHLIPLLLKSGAKVRVISRNPPTEAEYIEGVEYVSGSVIDLESLYQACVGVEGIFHLAGLVIHSRLPEFQRDLYETNVIGTLNVLKAAKKANCKRVVYASTSGTIGCSKDPHIIPDDAPYCLEVTQNWPYYAGKIESEIKGKKYALENDIDFIMMRPSVMLGPGDSRFRSTHFILSFIDGQLPVIPPGGYSFVDVRDAAAAFHTAMAKGRPNEGYLLAAWSPTTAAFLEVLSHVSGFHPLNAPDLGSFNELGARLPLVKLPRQVMVPLVRIIDFFNRKIKGEWKSSMDPVRAEMGVHYWNISNLKAREELDFDPRDPNDTIRDTVEWINQNRVKYGHPPKQAKL